MFFKPCSCHSLMMYKMCWSHLKSVLGSNLMDLTSQASATTWPPHRRSPSEADDQASKSSSKSSISTLRWLQPTREWSLEKIYLFVSLDGCVPCLHIDIATSVVYVMMQTCTMLEASYAPSCWCTTGAHVQNCSLCWVTINWESTHRMAG